MLRPEIVDKLPQLTAYSNSGHRHASLTAYAQPTTSKRQFGRTQVFVYV